MRSDHSSLCDFSNSDRTASTTTQRPFPLQGKYYANVFIHFEPTGRLLKDVDDNEMVYGSPKNPARFELGAKLPPYVIPGTAEAQRYSRYNPWGWGHDADFDDWDDDGWDDDNFEEESDDEEEDYDDDLLEEEEDWEYEHYDSDEDGNYWFEEEILKRDPESFAEDENEDDKHDATIDDRHGRRWRRNPSNPRGTHSHQDWF